MSKMWLITRREYLTRVRNKTFLLSTFLLPVVFILFIAGAVLIQLKTKTHNRIAVIDANGFFSDYLKGDSALTFDFSPGIDSLNYEQHGCSAVLIIPKLANSGKTECRLKYKKALGLEQSSALDDRIHDAVTDHMIYEQTTVSRAKLDSIRQESDITHVSSFEDSGPTARASSQTSAYIIGYVSGILIYLLTFIYGAAVMRGVMEEKTNRIAEVMVSSVRPFELMWGKITGIGAVGLTQFLLWVVLLGAIGFIAQAVIPHDTLSNLPTNGPMSGGAAAATAAIKAQSSGFNFSHFIINTNMGLIVFCFLFYFIGGYLFYSALFAAVGSAVNEDPQEAQSLMLPITLPVVFSFVIMTVVVQDPSGPLATWASIIPFSSPIVMMARIPAGVPGTVPYWQLGLSMALLVLGFLGTTWLAGKIYRIGILMYGKKPSWKIMWKWAFRSN
ncbi:MAG TPA: ABC transporter permease [Puia sp.]|nr:ABC transporter permease [Puia sp.]